MNMKQCSETSAYKIQTQGNDPEESVQHSEHGESLKSRVKKTKQVDTSGVATPTTLNAPVLSTVFEIPKWSIHCYGPTMAHLLYIHT